MQNTSIYRCPSGSGRVHSCFKLFLVGTYIELCIEIHICQVLTQTDAMFGGIEMDLHCMSSEQVSSLDRVTVFLQLQGFFFAKPSQKSRSVLKDGSRPSRLFRKDKTRLERVKLVL